METSPIVLCGYKFVIKSDVFAVKRFLSGRGSSYLIKRVYASGCVCAALKSVCVLKVSFYIIIIYTFDLFGLFQSGEICEPRPLCCDHVAESLH